MCELFGFSAASAARLRFGWKGFAMRGSRERGNPDGWGVAWYAQRDALLLREPQPAARSPLVRFLAGHAPASRLLISHVRRATRGTLTLENTQPFLRMLAGRAHLFAHNGFVAEPGPPRREPFLQPAGETDSERLFLLLLADLLPLWDTGAVPPLARRLAVLDTFAARMRARGAVNFLYFDGETLFAHAHRHTLPGAAISTEPGLYLLEREDGRASGSGVPCAGLACDGIYGAHAAVATMPLDEQAWKPLAAGEIACLEAGRRLR